MSFLDTLKSALSGKVATEIESALPTVITDAAEVAADPTKMISIFAQLVSAELEKLTASHAALAQSVQAVSQVAAQAAQTAQAATQAVQAIPSTGSAVVDAADLATSVFAALEPKLAPFTQAINILAQHFPALNPAPATAPAQTPAQ
jgi:hypothetical protein